MQLIRGRLLLTYAVSCVVMTSLRWGACALECFACHDLKSKFRCKTTQICNSGEVCLVQKVTAKFQNQYEKEESSIFYNMACKKRDACLNQYTQQEKFNVKSHFITACCCTDRCLEEDGTGFEDYANCYNALTYEEAKGRTTSSATATPPRLTDPRTTLMAFLIAATVSLL